ncbi:hypothetical protein ILUMI_01388 [Ignelater luminosus]|uniref:Exoribonuclease phosphorolytic domain-containing protein n=1 Tax=Ignelater luminosus TaxID=2038154 RepID=A0A8K0GHH5_IGNLU|nr:hypothetical protein ILUMI_01388 [Ignelater luminosus]
MSSINCKLGVLSRPDGSALLTQGETTVMAGIYGPIEVKSQKLLINKASVEVCYRPKAGLPGIGDKFYESIIQNICEAALVSVLYPRSSILVVIQEMQNYGGLIACAVNACCLALLSSGIDMKFLIASVSCAMDNQGILHLNPDKIIWQNATATFVFVFDSTVQRIVASHTSGSFSSLQYQDALDLCKNGSKEVFEFYKTVIAQEISHES